MKEKLNEISLKIFVPPFFSSLLFALVCVPLTSLCLIPTTDYCTQQKHNDYSCGCSGGWMGGRSEGCGGTLQQKPCSRYLPTHKKCAPPLSLPLFPLHLCLYLCVIAHSTHHFPQTQKQQTTSVCHFERPSHKLLYVHRRLILPQVPQIHRGRSLWGQSEVKGQGLCSGW